MKINVFLSVAVITNKHRTYVPRPTDVDCYPVCVIYTADEEELLDSVRSAHEGLLPGTCESVSVINDEASRYYQDTSGAFLYLDTVFIYLNIIYFLYIDKIIGNGIIGL